VAIDDSGYTPTYTGAFNFVNGVSQSNEYTYDKNGNLTKDLNKNISSIQYNLLNLPTSITYSSGKSAAYIYDATGRKLRTSYKASASATAVPTDYCGNMIYENGVLKQILVDGGYISFSGSAPYYLFYLKDHLGNNCVALSPSGTAEQVNHYYPFGGLLGESTGNTVQRFRYNGKELDRTHGLDWYVYGARHMSPDVGRFTTIDPMAEKYYSISPYSYCANDPVNHVDPDGKKVVFVNGFLGFGSPKGGDSYRPYTFQK
jgi:RHS repeat-associated protein